MEFDPHQLRTYIYPCCFALWTKLPNPNRAVLRCLLDGMEPEPTAAGTRKPPPTASAGHAIGAAKPWASRARESSLLAAAAGGLVAVGLGGGALLVWWAVAFHRANARLWMVPAGLVLLGTPIVAWLAVFASGPCDRSRVPPRAVLYELP
ncbi:hypothetical protein BRADI_3g51703v3 [Brachypodium distachyon]|uniref:Uncharacterized protein n=1 Tax=Brachypodium distachyon TaxID=15368 RepID=A0A2K2D4P2_BRADI|nr:hypothetical protein BRADI_3g51703v3 [Brachypodium distachyon]